MIDNSFHPSGGLAARAFSFSVCAALALAPSTSFAQDAEAASRQELVVASVAYNFARFIQWRAAESGVAPTNLVFCIVDDDASSAWRQIDGKSVGERKVRLEYLGAAPSDSHNCDMAYISETAIKALSLNDLAESGVVTISDAKRFSKQGGAIELSVTDKGASFDVNQRSLNRAGARISSKLMRVGMKVSLSGG